MSADINVSARPNEIIPPFDYSNVHEIADDLRNAAEKICDRTFGCLIGNGVDFLVCRDRLEHGQFCRWVESECRLSVRTAELSMMVAKYVAENGKTEIISLLPPTLQYLIAAPSTPQPIRDHVLGCYAQGQRLKVKDVKQMLRTAKDGSGQSALTTGDQSDAPTPDDEQRKQEQAAEAEAAEAEATEHQPVTLSKEGLGGGLGENHLVTEQAETASADEVTRSVYVEKIIDLLDKEVTSKGLLITLLNKVGYDDLARGLQARDDERVRAAA